MKKPFIYLITAGLAVSMIVNTSTTYAVTSDANVTFTPPSTSEPVLPLDPTDPTQPLNPTEEDGYTGEAGPLSIDYVTNLNFGSKELDLASTEQLRLEAETLNPSLQVSDRRQTGEGWKVTAALSNFENDNVNSLKGANITLFDGTSISPLNNNEDSENNLNAPTVSTPISLSATNTATDVVTAEAATDSSNLSTAEGLGTWITSWLSTTDTTNGKVVLTVPARTATAGNHSAKITWTLTDGPGN